MSSEQSSSNVPDLTRGVKFADLTDGKLLGRVGKEDVLLVHTGDGLFAIDASCSHYHGPLAEGLVVGTSIRCPWHHACFDLRSGEATRAPALHELACWQVEHIDDRIFVRGKRERPRVTARASTSTPERVVIVGGGAAGFAAAEMLRRYDFRGVITMLSQDPVEPVDRPNLSKDYLAGNAQEDWLPLQPKSYYGEARIDLQLGATVTAIDPAQRLVKLSSGQSYGYDRLLLATGAQAIRPSIAGIDTTRVYTLRSLADCRAIIEAAQGARRAMIIGASFIGLETAAALRTRGIDVHVIMRRRVPMERVFGAEMGEFIRALHEEHGVVFHAESNVTAFKGRLATLDDGTIVEADFVVVGVGVQPRLGLAEQLGLARDRGVLVDAYLETSIPGIYAAGDIARWPDPHSGDNIRVEHWTVAERQGQTVARNILGKREKFDAVPFFWSQHYDVSINYVGHAERWDAISIDGDIKAKDCLLQYKYKGRTLATVTIFRDLASLQAELAMELHP